MDVCRDCDHPLDDDDRFCSRCGTAVGGPDRTVALAAPSPSGPSAAAASPSGSSAAAPPPSSSPSAAGPPFGPDAGAASGTALASLESALRADTTDAGRLVFAGFQRLCAGEVDDALLAAESALAMSPRLWSAHLMAGVTRNQRGETEHAEAHLHDALQAEPLAVHHKATLERMLALATPRRFSLRRVRIPSLSPTAWAAWVAVPVLLIGLLWAENSVRTARPFVRYRAGYRAVEPAGPSSSQSLQPTNQPFPAPAPRPAPAYVPPPTAYTPTPRAFTPPMATQPSAAPPLTPDETPAYSSGDRRMAEAARPGPLPRAGDGGPVFPLSPAQPDLGGAPELQVRRRGPSGEGAADSADRGTAAAGAVDSTPWTRTPQADRNAESPGFTLRGTAVGRARVGYEPASRPNLPPPSDAVTSSAQVQPAPAAPPRHPVAASVESRAPDRSAAPESTTESRPSGRELQATARRLQNEGRWEEAKQSYRDAIAAYQDEIDNGRNPRAAEYGIAASKAALDLLESSH